MLEAVPVLKAFKGFAISFVQETKVAAANTITQKEIIVFFIKNDFYCKKICLKENASYGWVVLVESIGIQIIFDLIMLEEVAALKLFKGLAVSFVQETKVAAANAITQKEIIVFFIKMIFCCKKVCLKITSFIL